MGGIGHTAGSSHFFFVGFAIYQGKRNNLYIPMIIFFALEYPPGFQPPISLLECLYEVSLPHTFTTTALVMYHSLRVKILSLPALAFSLCYFYRHGPSTASCLPVWSARD